MRAPPTVYLDSQDYSRFGDVLRGKSDADTEALFLDLEARKSAGDVIFAVSMPIIGELFQYNANFRETTIKKTEAIERLCGTWSLAFPSRLLAAQIIDTAKSQGLGLEAPEINVLTSDRYWYPNIAASFEGLRDKMRLELDQQISAMSLSRHLRRGVAKNARKVDFYKIAQEAAPVLAADYGIPAEAITQSIVQLLRGKISPEQASHKLFSAIAEPVKFVEVYFERIQSDRSLPSWIGKLGRDLKSHLTDLRQTMLPALNSDSDKTQFRSMVWGHKTIFGKMILSIALDETQNPELDRAMRGLLANNPDFSDILPACDMFGNVLASYVEQVTGLRGTAAGIEDSLGGDILHALYLPYVDLWRGDRRFSHILKSALPAYADRIVPTVKELPVAIDNWLTERSPDSK